MLVKTALKNQSQPTNILSSDCGHLCSNPPCSYRGISYVLSISVRLAEVCVSISGGLRRPQKLTFFFHLFYHLHHPSPTSTASFPHNPSLWLLFRVGPGDRRRLTECISLCMCLHSCILWAAELTFFRNAFTHGLGWLAEVREWAKALWFRPL